MRRVELEARVQGFYLERGPRDRTEGKLTGVGKVGGKSLGSLVLNKRQRQAVGMDRVGCSGLRFLPGLRKEKIWGQGAERVNVWHKLEELQCFFPLQLNWPVSFNKECNLCRLVTFFISTRLYQQVHHQIMNIPRDSSEHNQREILK